MEALKIVTFFLAAITSGACMWFLFRRYRQTGMRLLLWSALCFVGLTVSNFLLVLDLSIFTQFDFRPYRLFASLAGVSFLLFGFVWEANRR